MKNQSFDWHKRHNVTILLYHVVFLCKYRKAVLVNGIDDAIKYICLEIEKRYETMLFFDKIVCSELYKYEDEIMSYADYLRQEGRQEGEHNAQQKIAMEFLRDCDSV